MEEIIGHSKILNGINLRKINNTFSHANLLSGNDGIGKSVIAHYISNLIISPKNGVTSVDIVEYRPKTSSFGVNEIRNIIDEVNKKPYEGDKKVIILYECNKMTVQAQNALLKTIEEPPMGVFLILLTSSLETILDTIQSRCQIYKLTPLSKEDMIKYIQTNHPDINKEQLRASLAYSTGIPGKADDFLRDNNIQKLRSICVELLEDLLKKDIDIVIKYNMLFKEFKEKKFEILDIITLLIRDIILLKEIRESNFIANLDKVNDLQDIAKKLSYKKLSIMLEYIEESRVSFNNNTNYSMTMSVLLMEFAEV